jgi:MFS family permease
MYSSGDRSRRTLAILCVASMGWAFSFGLGAPLASLWLRDAGWSSRAIGLNTSAYYLGVALASLFVPWLMRRANRACVITGMVLDAATTALFPLCEGAALWMLLRLVGGAGTALSLIPMETLVNRNAPPERRARDFGFYAVGVALGIALGSVIGLQLYHDTPKLAFALGGLVTLLSTALAWWGVPARDLPPEEGAGGDVPLVLPATFLGFGTAWAQGFLEGGMLAFLSIYLLGLGFTEGGASGLLGGLFLGVVLAQLPVAWLADCLGRLRVLLLCHALLLTGLAWTPFCRAAPGLAAWLFLLGATCGALYPLGLALIGERVPKSGLARANAWYLACNCAGSLSGPVLIGAGIDFFGPRAQFAVGAGSLLVVLAAWGAWAGARSERRCSEAGQEGRERRRAA